MAHPSESSEFRLGTGLATFGVIAASVCFGLVPFFARSLTDQGMAPHAIAFWRYALTALILLPALRVPRALWPLLLWGVSAGIVLGLGWVGYVRAVQIAPISTAGVLYMTYPVFTLIIARTLFGDIPSRRAILAALLIVLAAVIATSPAAVSPDQIPALLISLSAPIGFGFGITVLVHKLPPLRPVTRLACVTLGSVIGLTPLMLGSEPATLIPSTSVGWLLVLGIAIGTALIPQILYTICVPLIGTARTAMAGSIELPTMFLVGWFAFSESVTFAQWIACAIVIGAIIMTPSKITRNLTTTIARQSTRTAK